MTVLSPGPGLPGIPLPYRLGFGPEPVGYPATRTRGATPRKRAPQAATAHAP